MGLWVPSRRSELAHGAAAIASVATIPPASLSSLPPAGGSGAGLTSAPMLWPTILMSSTTGLEDVPAKRRQA